MQKLIRLKTRLKARPIWQFAIAAMIGFLFAFFASPEFLGLGFGIVLLAALIFAVLCQNGAVEDSPISKEARFVSSILFRTSRPTAKVTDLMALRCFFFSLTLLAAMMVGAFAAVPFQ